MLSSRSFLTKKQLSVLTVGKPSISETTEGCSGSFTGDSTQPSTHSPAQWRWKMLLFALCFSDITLKLWNWWWTPEPHQQSGGSCPSPWRGHMGRKHGRTQAAGVQLVLLAQRSEPPCEMTHQHTADWIHSWNRTCDGNTKSTHTI